MDALSPRLTRGAKPPPGGFCFSRTIVNWGDDVSPRRPRTRVYTDGFNVHYAAFRRARFQPYKWLDRVAFCRVALPRNDVQFVEYFTAPLDPSRGREGQHGPRRARVGACVFAKQADFVRTVRCGHFAAAQLPDELADADGRRITKVAANRRFHGCHLTTAADLPILMRK